MPKDKIRKLHFVVQRHKASHLHYDLRLEIAGTLKSWALKKGPSMNPHDRRLAVFTKDHPLLYRFYRGIVPGPIWRGSKITKLGWRMVEIWDKGYYIPYELPVGADMNEYMQQCLSKGVVKIIFYGKKLKGTFILVKIFSKGKSFYNSDRSWLLIKQEDEYAVHDPYDSEKLTPGFSFINRALKKEK
jgi:bifunctional non-homologous end joining protein LigD